MRPLIKDLQFVFILPCRKIHSGDVVLYRLGDNNFLHRVKKITKDKIILIDDAGIISPVEISKENVVGIYPTFFSGFLGMIYNFIVRMVFIFFRKIKSHSIPIFQREK